MTPQEFREGLRRSQERLAAISYQNGWMRRGLAYSFEYARANQQFEGGKLYQYAQEQGLEQPPHHNWWVTLVGRAAKAGMMRKICYVPPSTPQSHIKSLVLWESRVFHSRRANLYL